MLASTPMNKPRIAIPVPTASDPDYNQRSWPQYAKAVARSGGEPVAIPLDDPPAATAKLIASCQGVLLPGSGADVNPQKFNQPTDPNAAPPDAARENVDELLLQDAHNLRKPILAICFGTQMLNVWRGGSLIQHLPEQPVNHRQRGVAEAHEADIPPDTLLAHIVGEQPSDPEHLPGSVPAPQETITMPINSSHHQAIGTPGDALRVSARSHEDGVIEAVEGTSEGPGGPFIVGVQWHPERTFDSSSASRALFARFVAEAAAWTPTPLKSASTS